MKPVKHDYCNAVLGGGAPHIPDLHIRRGDESEDGSMPVTASYWALTTAELRELADGGVVEVVAMGYTHPPLSIRTAPPNAASRASDRVRSTETEGLGPEGEERGPEGMRPEKSSEREAPSVQVVEPTEAEIDLCRELAGLPAVFTWGESRYDLRPGIYRMVGHLFAQASALPAAQQPAVEPVAPTVGSIARALLDEWKRVDPRSNVAQHPESYVANFADMARVAIRLLASPTAQPGEKL